MPDGGAIVWDVCWYGCELSGENIFLKIAIFIAVNIYNFPDSSRKKQGQ